VTARSGDDPEAGRGGGGRQQVALSTEQLDQVKDVEVHSSDGQPVGTVEGIYLDDPSGEPEWALVRTPWFGHRATFVPLKEARLERGVLVVPYDPEKARGAPVIDPDGSLSEKEEAELYKYYGLPYPRQRGLRTTRYYDLYPNRQLWV
jgi:hypothetical protein